MVLANIMKDRALLWVFLLVSVQPISTNPETSQSSITARPPDHSETVSHLTPSGAHKTNQQTSSGYLKATLTPNNVGIITKLATAGSSVSPLAEIEDTRNTQTAVTAGMAFHPTPLKVSDTLTPTVRVTPTLITSLGPSDVTTSASTIASPLVSSTSKKSFTPITSTTAFSDAPIQEVKHTTEHTMTSASATTTTTNTLVATSSDSKTTSWPAKITEMSTKADLSSMSPSQSSSMKISHSSTIFPVTITPSPSATEGTTLSPTPNSTNSSVGMFIKDKFASTPHPQASTKTKSRAKEMSPTTETTLPFSATPNSITKLPLKTTKSLPPAPPKEKPSEKEPLPCSINQRGGVVNTCLIAIAVLALIATIFMVSTVILCAKLSARKHRYRCSRESQRGTELVCISGLMPEKNGPYWRGTNPRSNGALLPSTEYDSDGDLDDNLTLNSFLPENDRVV